MTFFCSKWMRAHLECHFSNNFVPAINFHDIRDDVVEECNKHGAVMHIYVDKASPQGNRYQLINRKHTKRLMNQILTKIFTFSLTPGNVYVKCVNVSTAVAAVNALHGRWFAGFTIILSYFIFTI